MEELEKQLDEVLQTARFKAPADLSMEQQIEFIKQKKAEVKADFLASYQAKEDRTGNQTLYKNEIPQMSVTSEYKSPLSVKEIFSKAYSHNLVSTLNTREDAHLLLKSQGYNPNSKEYGEQLLKIYKENPQIR